MSTKPGDGTVAPPGQDLFANGGSLGALIRAHDWTATSLGPVEVWPQSLRTVLYVILTSRHPMFLWWGPDLIQFYNAGYRPSLGEDGHPAALGARGREFWAEIWPIIGPEIEAVMQHGESTWHEDHLVPIARNARKEEVYWTYSYSPVPDDDGRIGGTLVTVQETTTRVLTERRMAMLRVLAERTASEARTVPDLCHIVADVLAQNTADIAFALLYLSDADGRTLRLTSRVGALPSQVCPETVPLAEVEANERTWPLAQVARSGRVVVLTDLRSRFGTLPGGRWPEPVERAIVLPIARVGQENSYGVLVVGISPRLGYDEHYRGFLDLVVGQIAGAITNTRAHEQERTRAEALAELDRAKIAFFSNVSHEFRTPLTLFLAPIEDLLDGQRGALPTAQRAELVVAHRNALRLLKLVNALLDFSRIEAGRMQAVYEPIDLAAFTAELASSFRSAIERAGLRLVVDCPPLPAGVEMYVDREMWERIVLNLLSNAFKFTFAGEIAVSLNIAGTGAQPTLTVRDSGVGIAPEALPHLFERFYRAPERRARTHEGTGIGLSLVQELVRLHGGTIAVESTVGTGTTFTVTLPAGAAHLPAEHVGAARSSASTVFGAVPFVEEVLRWLPEGAEAESPTAGVADTIARLPPTPHARPSWSWTTTPTCATISRACSPPAMTCGSLPTARRVWPPRARNCRIWC